MNWRLYRSIWRPRNPEIRGGLWWKLSALFANQCGFRGRSAKVGLNANSVNRVLRFFARCPVAFAALGKDRGLKGNFNRIPKGGSCPIGISASLPQTRRLVPYPIGISPSMAQDRGAQRRRRGVNHNPEHGWREKDFGTGGTKTQRFFIWARCDEVSPQGTLGNAGFLNFYLGAMGDDVFCHIPIVGSCPIRISPSMAQDRGPQRFLFLFWRCAFWGAVAAAPRWGIGATDGAFLVKNNMLPVCNAD